MKILHITPHLGGGVGKVLSELVKRSKTVLSDIEYNIEHTIVCLDKPEKQQFINIINSVGNKVIIEPTENELVELIKNSDIVQLEFWNHPILFKYICTIEIPKIRLLVWYHNNGLYNPIMPKKLLLEAHMVLYTSSCSYQNVSNTGYVFSSGGFKEFPKQKNKNYKSISVGYVGGTNFSKLHPDYAEYINEVDIPNFKVKIIGDLYNKEILEKQSTKFEFKGFIPNLVDELKSINILAYLLNPYHYGTTENSLLQAMSMGVVPIVLDNKCEIQIVIDNYTGFIIHNKKEFAEKIKFLANNSNKLEELGNNASDYVRNKFTIENTEFELKYNYYRLMNKEKRKIDFKKIFGNNPEEWFLSCQT